MGSKVATVVFAAIVGSVILFLGVPRTIAAFVVLPGQQVLQSVQSGETVDRQKLESFVALQRRALAWVHSGRVWRDLAVGQLFLAAPRKEDEELSQELVEQALDSLRAGLSVTPASPHGWTSLAYGELLAHGPSSLLASTVTMSMLTGRYKPDLTFARMELGFAAWGHFSLEDRDVVFDQVRRVWRQSPNRLVRLAKRTDRIDVVRAALAQSPDELSEFQQRLRRIASGS